MQDRFKQLLEEKNLTATRFAAMIKVNASAMSHILNGRSKPGFDVLDKIAQAFPDVNLNWLVSGKGSLYNTYAPSTAPIETNPGQRTIIKEEIKQTPGTGEEKFIKEEQVIQTSMPVIPTVSTKKIKRIILFFEDGSFEDYEKG